MDDNDQKRLALNLLLDAWEAALGQGVEADVLASVAIYAALADMIDHHGADAVAAFCEGLPARIRAGEFTLKD